jgi:signal transduction histidine kinase
MDFTKAAIGVLIPTTVNTYYMIYMGGGIKAPATYWIAIFPFLYSLYFDKKGMIVGSLVTLTSYLSYILLDHYIDLPMIASWPHEYKQEKIYNLFYFSTIFILFYFSFSSTYEKANRQLELQKETIDNLFRVVLHDITNPLSVIKLRLGLIKMKKDLSGLDSAERALDKIVTIIENIREFKAIEDGSISILLKRERVDSIVSSFKNHVNDLEKLKDIEIVFNDSELSTIDEILCHKESLLVQVLMNILSNGIKFSEKKSKILISVYSDADLVTFKIQDFGVGIPESIIKDLFRFDRVTSRPGTSGEQGTGYGMPIAKYFLESMNADLEITSSVKEGESQDHGTTFKVVFKKVISG